MAYFCPVQAMTPLQGDAANGLTSMTNSQNVCILPPVLHMHPTHVHTHTHTYTHTTAAILCQCVAGSLRQESLPAILPDVNVRRADEPGAHRHDEALRVATGGLHQRVTRDVHKGGQSAPMYIYSN